MQKAENAALKASEPAQTLLKRIDVVVENMADIPDWKRGTEKN